MRNDEAVERSVMIFTIGGRTLALALEDVVEVVRRVALTPVADAPSWVTGAINVRGRTVTVIDPRLRLGTPVTPPALDDLIILVATSGGTVGVIAEGVQGVDRLIEPQPSGPAGAAPSGVGRVGDRLVPLLDVENLCAPAPGRAGARRDPEATHAGT